MGPSQLRLSFNKFGAQYYTFYLSAIKSDDSNAGNLNTKLKQSGKVPKKY